MPHDHADSDAPHSLLPCDPALRVKALETILMQKGLVDPAALDEIIDTYENRIGPRNGATVVARAWSDPAFRAALLADADPVLAEFGVSLPRDCAVRVWDSTAEVRYLVLPQRPAGCDHLDEAALADLVTRDAMVGCGLVGAP